MEMFIWHVVIKIHVSVADEKKTYEEYCIYVHNYFVQVLVKHF